MRSGKKAASPPTRCTVLPSPPVRKSRTGAANPNRQCKCQNALPSNLYNLLMLQSGKEISPAMLLFSQIQSDDQFRNHHLSKQNRGVFKMIRLGFQAMLALLHSYGEKELPPSRAEALETLKAGGKLFAYSEYKLFIWVSVWLINRHKISYNQIFTADLGILERLFSNKEQVLLRFQFFLVLAMVEKRSCAWRVRESQMLDALTRREGGEREGEGEEQDKRTNWRLISYRMFTEKSYAKTPHECRERWINHLNPALSKSKWKLTDDLQLLSLCQEHGPKWSKIAKLIGNRNEHMVKNRFNSIKNKWVKKAKLPFKIRKAIKEIKNSLESGNRSDSSVNHSQCKAEQQQPQVRVMADQVQISQGQQQHNLPQSQSSQYLLPPPQEEARQDPQYEQTFINLGQTNRLSLADVEQCDFEQQSPRDLLSVPHEFSTRFIWMSTCEVKEDSRRETADDDYVWLDDMIEQKNMNWLEDLDF